jgi:DNA-binding transcriptional MerR regulator
MAIMTSNTLSIGELSRLSGVSPHTLRYYEAEGILMPATRAANGHRRYRAEDALWLEFVLRLKLTGMPLAEIRQYAALRAQGDRTLQPRLAMLKLHRERLGARIDELATYARTLDDKIRTYRRMIARSRAPTGKAGK